MICPNCGHESSGKFCTQCGAKLFTEAPMKAAEELLNQAQAANPQTAAGEAMPHNEPQAPANNTNPVFTPNQGYAPNQSYAPNQNYAPNQGYAPNQNYAPNQGYNASGAPAAAVGNTPARQLVRKLATSPAFVIALLAMTLSFGILLVRGISTFSLGIERLGQFASGSPLRTQTISILITTGISVLFSLISVLFLWSIFGSAASKRNERMSTAGLTFYKVCAILAIILLCILLLLLLIGFGIALAQGLSLDDIIKQFNQSFSQSFSQYGNLGSALSDMEGYMRSYLIIAFCIPLLILALAIIFSGKMIKTINTGKRVILTGLPDDRVSSFVAVIEILIAVFAAIGGISTLVAGGGTSNLLTGISTLLGALAAICFAVVIFKFREGMRRLGAYKGVIQQSVY